MISPRSVLNRSNALAKKYESMIKSFHKVFFYENFPASVPTKIIDYSFDYIPEINRLIRWWNEIIYVECSSQRHLPVSDAIATSIEQSPIQFVNADSGLVLTLLMDPTKIPHLVSGELDLPKYEQNKYRLYTLIRNNHSVEDISSESFITIYSTDEEVKIAHGFAMREILNVIRG